jgi:hypothetical protein
MFRDYSFALLAKCTTKEPRNKRNAIKKKEKGLFALAQALALATYRAYGHINYAYITRELHA